MFRKGVPAPLRAVEGRVIAHGRAEDGWVAATATYLVVVPDAGERVQAAWHTVDAGAWDREQHRLTVRLHDGREIVIAFPEDAPGFIQAFHERVGASVVLSRQVSLGGGTVRLAVRKNLATRELFDVVIPGEGADVTSPGAARALAAERAELREEVGLDPL